MPRIHPVETTTQQRIEISEATVSNKGARVEESPETTSAKAPTMLQQLCRTVNRDSRYTSNRSSSEWSQTGKTKARA
ncbi:unnamed protein product [Brassica oleracea var. botrytis]